MFASLLALVLVPGLFWHDVWFGRTLDDAELEEYLNDETSPRRMQHGLAQLGERIGRGDPEARRWYPRVMELAGHDQPEIRNLSAWLMGQDVSEGVFRQSLAELLKDPNPLVRRNAALSLVRFGDGRGRPELRSMLRPWVVESPQAGRLRLLVEADDEVRSGSPVAEIGEGETSVAVQVPVAGTAANLAEDGQEVDAGAELMVLLPDPVHLWEALRALYLVGTEEDLDLVELYLGAGEENESIRSQAHLTREAILKRSIQREEKVSESGTGDQKGSDP
ncbi:MAG: hypothetical protein OXH11_18025 [Candidatus Aminicenantes bacterium]|nr:hypothetical protein [Candidatus Aminicenantes bacterium]